MTKSKQNKPISNRGIFRAFELFIEIIGWLQIIASPLLIGLIIGAAIYFSKPTTIRLIIGIGVMTLGLVVGFFWATRQWKGKGTVRFMSKIIANPELDDLDIEHENPKSTNHDAEKGTANKKI